MRLFLLCSLALTGCFKAWDSEGPWACSEGNVCPEGFACDEGLCCVPGGAPACLTLPYNGKCADGGTALTFFADEDGDGEGNENIAKLLCAQPSGLPAWVRSRGDCDDTDATINSQAQELCDGLDNNCDGQLDDGLPDNGPYYLDQDGDDFGDDSAQLSACAPPPGYVAQGGDCDPESPARYPGAAELCNNLDDDCDGVSDALETVFADTGTAFPCLTGQAGVCSPGRFECSLGVRVCQRNVEPSREVCDGLDNNCDSRTDEQPECGGPAQLFGEQTVRHAKRKDSSALATRCHRTAAGTDYAVAGSAWSGVSVGGNDHVLFVAPADGGVWDLTKLDGRLYFSFNATDAGWGASTGFNSDPVVYLCGEEPEQFIRYVPSPDRLHENSFSWDGVLPLHAHTTPQQWIAGSGSGFDASRVHYIQFHVRNINGANGFTIAFADAGFQ